MADSFFEKLKKGMGIEEGEVEEAREEKPKRRRGTISRQKTSVTRASVKGEDERSSSLTRVSAKGGKEDLSSLTKPKEEKVIITQKEDLTEPEPELEPEPKEEIKEEPSFTKAAETKEKWFETEGELAIDVYQTDTDLVVQSAIAGVKPEDLDIALEKDIITIKGSRERPYEEEGDYFAQECYWGSFSREIILPVEVDPDRAEATMKEGILTIRIPKILREKRRRIKVKI